MSRPELAEKLDVSVPTVWRYETGVNPPDDERKDAIAKLTNGLVNYFTWFPHYRPDGVVIEPPVK